MGDRYAFQMDPMHTLHFPSDSSFALMVEAQRRGASMWHYDVRSLRYDQGKVCALARPVSVYPDSDIKFTLGEPLVIDLADDVDVVFMRQNPPFNLSYITATHLLDELKGKTLVVNDPSSVRNAPEKLMVLGLAEYAPPTLITSSLEAVIHFHKQHGEIVLKPLYGNAGLGVVYVGPDRQNLAATVELFSCAWQEPFIAQKFMPEVRGGDRRIILVNGEVAGLYNRVPASGEIRSNFAAGGTVSPIEMSEREIEICNALGPKLREAGLLFVGIDVIGGQWLSEINVTSPTGVQAIREFYGVDVAAMIIDNVSSALYCSFSYKTPAHG